jgi:hypothetical protein
VVVFGENTRDVFHVLGGYKIHYVLNSMMLEVGTMKVRLAINNSDR